MVDERGASWIPSPHHWNGREGKAPRWLILHGTAGGSSAEAIANWFAHPASQVSAHYIVGRDGHIVQCVSESNAAWSNGVISGSPGTAGDGIHHDNWWDGGVNPNLLTISIEHVKPRTDNGDSLTDIQKKASFTLIKHICERRGIPPRYATRSGGITGHFSMDPVNRSRCPGLYPWNELWAFLQQRKTTVLQIQQVRTFFEEIEPGKRWRCKFPSSYDGNYYEIAYALLDFYRTFGQVGLNGLSIFGLPLSGEIRVPNTKSAIIQRCERGVMLYDPRKEVDDVPGLPGPCYPAHIDKGPGRDPRLDTK
jgi:N-acetyl-anhydromuramyl-L-alanine amidase AmpD